MEYKDLTNQTFGGITALERDDELSKQKHRGWWKCRCNYCGKEVYYPTDRLQKGPYSCGCVKKPRYNFVDETGNTYGRLTVISRNTEKHSKSGAYWNCHCECGGTIVVDTYSLHRGSTVSCGCKSREFYKYTPKKMKLVIGMALSLFLSETMSTQKIVLLGGLACANAATQSYAAALPCGPAIIYLVAVSVDIAEKQLLPIYLLTNPLVIKHNKLLKTFVSPKLMAYRALTLVFTQKTNWFFLSNIMVSNIINMLNTSRNPQKTSPPATKRKLDIAKSIIFPLKLFLIPSSITYLKLQISYQRSIK